MTALQHGKASTYTAGGCRCDDCRKANTENTRQWRRERRILTMSLDVNTTRLVRAYADRNGVSYAETVRRAMRLLDEQR